MSRAKKECKQKMATYGHDLDKMVSGAIDTTIITARMADEHRIEQDRPKPPNYDQELFRAKVKIKKEGCYICKTQRSYIFCMTSAEVFLIPVYFKETAAEFF
jgi:hypothetical protein